MGYSSTHALTPAESGRAFLGVRGGKVKSSVATVVDEPDPVGLDPGPVIAIIESRPLLQSCLVELIGQKLGLSVQACGSTKEWLAKPGKGVSLLVFCHHSGAIDGPAREDLELLIERTGDIPIVVSADCEDAEAIRDALNLGARGYIPTSLKLDIWIEALRLVRAGGIFAPAASLMQAGAGAALARTSELPSTGPSRPPVNAVPLTSRQISVVDALRHGKANKVIAYELNMCESTVKVHVRNIMKKLRAKNRTEVALMAAEILRGQDGSSS